MKKSISLVLMLLVTLVLALFLFTAAECYVPIAFQHGEMTPAEQSFEESVQSPQKEIPEESMQKEETPASESAVKSPSTSQEKLNLPDGWPLPFNDKIILELSTSRNGDGYTVWEIVGIYPGSGEEIYNWYKSNLEGFSVEVEQVYDKGNNIKGYEYRIYNNSYKALLTFEDILDNQSSVSIYVETAD